MHGGCPFLIGVITDLYDINRIVFSEKSKRIPQHDGKTLIVDVIVNVIVAEPC